MGCQSIVYLAICRLGVGGGRIKYTPRKRDRLLLLKVRTRKPGVRPGRYRSGTAVCDRRGIGSLSPRVADLITTHCVHLKKHPSTQVNNAKSKQFFSCRVQQLITSFPRFADAMCNPTPESSYKDAGI